MAFLLIFYTIFYAVEREFMLWKDHRIWSHTGLGRVSSFLPV